MASKVGERGQITIEKTIREELGICAGDETLQRVEDGRIVIEVVPGRHRRSLSGSLKTKLGRRPDDESWTSLRRAAWEAPEDRLRAEGGRGQDQLLREDDPVARHAGRLTGVYERGQPDRLRDEWR